MTTLLTPAQARQEYHFGRNYLQGLIRDRKIPVIRLGPRKILLPRDGIEAFLRGKTIPAKRQFFGSHNQHSRTI